MYKMQRIRLSETSPASVCGKQSPCSNFDFSYFKNRLGCGFNDTRRHAWQMACVAFWLFAVCIMHYAALRHSCLSASNKLADWRTDIASSRSNWTCRRSGRSQLLLTTVWQRLRLKDGSQHTNWTDLHQGDPVTRCVASRDAFIGHARQRHDLTGCSETTSGVQSRSVRVLWTLLNSVADFYIILLPTWHESGIRRSRLNITCFLEPSSTATQLSPATFSTRRVIPTETSIGCCWYWANLQKSWRDRYASWSDCDGRPTRRRIRCLQQCVRPPTPPSTPRTSSRTAESRSRVRLEVHQGRIC